MIPTLKQLSIHFKKYSLTCSFAQEEANWLLEEYLGLSNYDKSPFWGQAHSQDV